MNQMINLYSSQNHATFYSSLHHIRMDISAESSWLLVDIGDLQDTQEAELKQLFLHRA